MCEAGSSPTSTVARPISPSSATSRATSCCTFAARAFPSMIVAAMTRTLTSSAGMATRLPRKNDEASIRARQEALGLDGDVTGVDLEPWTKAAETVTGVAVIPVSIAQLVVSLGQYELDDEGAVVETARAEAEVAVPLAHTEGGLTASMQRGSKAAGIFRTHVLADR